MIKRKKLFHYWLIVFIVGCTSGTASDSSSERWWTEEERQLIISELNRTTEELKLEIDSLTERQWYFRESPDRWNIAEIIEHLEMQNQLHYREISVVMNGPQQHELRAITVGKDQFFTKYATDTIKGQANWFMVPVGKFCTKAAGEQAFYLARGKLTELIQGTTIDLRKQFTYRSPIQNKDVNELKIGEVRDLHQLLLTGIAHTDRHLTQIRNLKKHGNYPID